ncbi:MAG: arginine--tRNA ligase, partial [bacterium]|nr:arginine--tRNA ligase [bacterium]
KFINFFLSREALVPIEQTIPQIYAGKIILVEYTSPNLFKPLHIGNLIGNILGESIARLFEQTGAEVKRLNYPSDIGLTVAKGVWGLLKTNGNPEEIQALGAAYVAGNAAYEDGSAKTDIEAMNVALYENNNPQWSELRRKGVETSRKHLDELCEKLGTRFDKEFFESESGPIGQKIVKENIGSVFVESEGAVVYHGAHTRVFLNSQGLPTYEAKEVGLFDLKSKAYSDFDMSYTVTGGEQKDFFAVVFDAVKKVFPEKTNGKILQHIANGFLKLTTGKMSSRLGNVVTGESLLDDLTKAARGREDVAVGAIKYTVLRSGSDKDIIFDPDKSLSLEGDSGPYIQYALVRAKALLREARKAGIEAGEQDKPSQANVLERTLVHFPEVVERAAKELEPHYVTTYITELAAAFNSWYASERVIGGPHPHYGVLLAKAVEQTLAKGLTVLGIPAPEKM